MTAMRVQVIVAHPDDETFGCGSLILLAKSAGATVAVTCATRGDAGEAARPGSTTDLGTVRAGELRAAADVLGVDRVDLLDFRDSGMSGEPAAGTLAAAPAADVQAALARVVADFRPDVVVTLDASDGHRDHAVVRDAALAVADVLVVPRTYLLCLPRSLMRGWVEHVRTANPEAEHLDAATTQLGTPDAEITTVLDASDHLAARERAIAVHASQHSPYAGLPDALYRAFLETVHLQRVRPAWPGGPPETELFA